MKSNAPYSSARRKANEQVAWNPMDIIRSATGTKEDRQPQGGDIISKQSRDKANAAGRVLEQTTPMGNKAVGNARKASGKSARILEEMGE